MVVIRLIVVVKVFDDKLVDLMWNICDIVIWVIVEVNLINVFGKYFDFEFNLML